MFKIENKKSLIINLICIFLYAIITLILVFNHEVWADEAQAWLVVRDLDILGIIKHVRTEGHPLLWYVSLLPFAKFGCNVFAAQILNWFFMLVATTIFLLKSPFHKITNICIITSSAFLYWYPIVTRSYGLMFLLLVLVTVLYKQQKDRPYLYATSLALLAHTHVISFGLSIALACLFFYQNILKEKDNKIRKKYIFPFLIIICSMLFVILYLNGSQNENFIVKSYNIKNNAFWLKNLYFEVTKNIYGYNNKFYSIILGSFIVFNFIFLLIKDKKLFFVYTTNILYVIAVFIFIWGMIPQRTFLLLFVPLFCVFILYKNLNTKEKILINTIFSLVFLLTWPNTLDVIKKDLKYPFSDSKNTAAYIKNNIPQNALLVTNSPISAASILAYLPKNNWKIFYVPYNNFFTYYDWKKPILNPYQTIPINEILKQVPKVYVITAVYLNYSNITPLYESNLNTIMDSEIFRIYKFERKSNERQ